MRGGDAALPKLLWEDLFTTGPGAAYTPAFATQFLARLGRSATENPVTGALSAETMVATIAIEHSQTAASGRAK